MRRRHHRRLDRSEPLPSGSASGGASSPKHQSTKQQLESSIVQLTPRVPSYYKLELTQDVDERESSIVQLTAGDDSSVHIDSDHNRRLMLANSNVTMDSSIVRPQLGDGEAGQEIIRASPIKEEVGSSSSPTSSKRQSSNNQRWTVSDSGRIIAMPPSPSGLFNKVRQSSSGKQPPSPNKKDDYSFAPPVTMEKEKEELYPTAVALLTKEKEGVLLSISATTDMRVVHEVSDDEFDDAASASSFSIPPLLTKASDDSSLHSQNDEVLLAPCPSPEDEGTEVTVELESPPRLDRSSILDDSLFLDANDDVSDRGGGSKVASSRGNKNEGSGGCPKRQRSASNNSLSSGGTSNGRSHDSKRSKSSATGAEGGCGVGFLWHILDVFSLNGPCCHQMDCSAPVVVSCN